MILLYHKIYPESPTKWWVTVNNFWRQMEELRRYKVVPLDEYNPSDPTHVSITFDGVYENVFTYAFPILKKFGYPFELFIVGAYIGKENKFDQTTEPSAKFVSLDQLKKMVDNGGHLQWHSWSHKPLNELKNIQEIEKEIIVPKFIKEIDTHGFKWFAYPHGDFNNILLNFVKNYFRGALSCHQGNDANIYCLNRTIVTNYSNFNKSSVSLIIANYNYGRFLAEAIESALRQTVIPEEILFIDDCSEDNSLEIAYRYKERIKIVKNERNLGIVDNFNKAVSLTCGDYICILGADNRLRSDYIEKCKLALDTHPDVAIAYTNIVIFGPRAEVLANKVNAKAVEGKGDTYLWSFPEFNEETKKVLKIRNFIHGSSMYRRVAFNEVGGYKKTESPEDHNLFLRIVERGWKAILCPDFLLEYRQHSDAQANTQLNLGLELAFYKKMFRHLMNEKNLIPETLKKISSLANENKIEEAINILKNTLRRFPEQAKLLLQYLLLMELKGEYRREILEISKLYDPVYTEEIEKRVFFKGKEFDEIQRIIKKGDEENAIISLENYINRYQNHALAYNDLGVLYY
ncbi:MAG: glycosyltransferase, partial [Bacteroidales bacterium]